MTDAQQLWVVTTHIGKLAALQETAAIQITGANRARQDIATNVSTTHGLICSATASAMTAIDAARGTAGSALHKASVGLNDKLTTASFNYQSTDYMAGKILDRNM